MLKVASECEDDAPTLGAHGGASVMLSSAALDLRSGAGRAYREHVQALSARLGGSEGMSAPLRGKRSASCETDPITFDGSSGNYVLKGRTKLGALVDIAMVPRKGLEPPQCCHR